MRLKTHTHTTAWSSWIKSLKSLSCVSRGVCIATTSIDYLFNRSMIVLEFPTCMHSQSACRHHDLLTKSGRSANRIKGNASIVCAHSQVVPMAGEIEPASGQLKRDAMKPFSLDAIFLESRTLSCLKSSERRFPRCPNVPSHIHANAANPTNTLCTQ